ncbi:NifU family protein [Streptomyces sp. NPDC004609]|uniref:NifU family protein n=1 Tax=Streptomyces sp. NPDC004609 TaxID=3364704 RepID=UPI0036B27693
MPWDDEEARRAVLRSEEMLAGLENLPDSTAAALAEGAVGAVVELYGQCLARVVGHAADDTGMLRRLADDDLVGHLLLVHDLHPDPVTERAAAALDAARPGLERAGISGAELLAVEGTVALVRLTAKAGCGCSSSESPETLVHDALTGRAPEIERVDVETAPAAAPQTVIPVDSLFRAVSPSCGRSG